MNTLTRLRFLVILLFISLFSSVCADESLRFQWERHPDPISFLNRHTVGSFGGYLGDRVLLAGGYCKDDSSFLNTVYLYSQSDGWEKSSLTLPEPLAFSGIAQDNNALILIGGDNGSELSSSVYRLSFVNGRLQYESLPSLPIALISPVCTVFKDQLYVAFGQSASEALSSMYVLPLNDPDSQWVRKEITGLPDAFTPVSATVQNSGTDDLWYFFTESDFPLAYSFKTGSWVDQSLSTQPVPKEIRRAVACGAAFPIGTHHIMIVGAHPANHIFHTVTRTWTTRGDYPYTPGDNNLIFRQGSRVCLLSDSGFASLTIRSKGTFGWINYTVLILYMLLMIGVGFWFSRKTISSDDFFKGGGKLPWWAVGISIFATTLSAITFMAIPAKTYISDWLYFPMAFSILIVAPVIIRWYLPFFRSLNLTSAYEYLEKRFNRTVRLLASSFFILFMITRIAIVLYLPSLALSTVTGMDIILCILLMSVVTVIYATMGGVEAVIWGDVIQGFILIGGALLSIVYIVINTGGIGETIRIAQDAHKFRMFDFAFDFTQPTFWVIFFGAGIANSLITYSSDQTIVQRYLTTTDEKAAAKSIWLNGLISLPVLFIFYFIGSGLYAYYDTHPDNLPVTMPNAEGIFPYFMVNEMPVGVAGLLIAAIFAATMSTLSSNINSASTAVTCDFVNLAYPALSDARRLLAARISGIVISILGTTLALILSTLSVKSFFDEFNMFIGLLTSGLGGLFLIGIFFPRIRGYAALGGLLFSTFFLIWMQSFSRVNFMMYGLLGIFLSIAIGYLLSFLFREKSRDLTGLCWKYRTRSE